MAREDRTAPHDAARYVRARETRRVSGLYERGAALACGRLQGAGDRLPRVGVRREVAARIPAPVLSP